MKNLPININRFIQLGHVSDNAFHALVPL